MVHCMKVQSDAKPDDARLMVGTRRIEINTSVPSFKRFEWPKPIPPLSASQQALAEAHRVLKANGIFSVVLPCDPRLANGSGRKLTATA
jgi:hypothetical protein